MDSLVFFFNQNEIFDLRENLAAFYFLFYVLEGMLFDPGMKDLSYILSEI